MIDNPQNSSDAGVKDWSRRQFLVGAGGLFVVGAGALVANTSIVRAVKSISQPKVDTGFIRVATGDYYFAPSHMTWRVGDLITLHQENQSPYRYHEMQIGRGFDTAPTLLEKNEKQQFATDFWDGVHVTILDQHGADNFTTNKAIIKLDTPAGPWLDTNQADGNFSPTLLPGGWVEYQFVVPDKPGVWEYACFVQGFIHYQEGMRGTINIIPKDA